MAISMHQCDVTIVLATHNRPEHLRVAVSSALAQTHTNWRLLVLADGCDKRTKDVVSHVGDDRVIFVDLSVRFFEQAGPNSIGMLLARSPWIALLNHDDIWLPDHLEHSLRTLKQTGADLCMAEAAVTRGPTEQFSHIDSECRLSKAFTDVNGFEPVSRWVFRRDVVDSVGPWSLAGDIYRMPIEDWLIRAWRNGVRSVSSDRVTVVRLTNARLSYAEPAQAHRNLFDRLSMVGPDEFRREIQRSIDHSRSGNSGAPNRPKRIKTGRAPRPVRRILKNPVTAEIFRMTGFDAFSLAAYFGQGKGAYLTDMLTARTGESLPSGLDLMAAVEAARAELDRHLQRTEAM